VRAVAGAHSESPPEMCFCGAHLIGR
jgi:hypothetical protein